MFWMFFRAMLYNRMKLMFVGIQGIGKTSLLAQLRREGKTLNSKNKVLIVSKIYYIVKAIHQREAKEFDLALKFLAYNKVLVTDV